MLVLLFLLRFLWMLTIFKVFIEFGTILFLFYVLVFLTARHVGCQLLDRGSNPPPHALEGEVLTPGSPGKSLVLVLTCIIFDHSYFYFANDLGLCLSIVVSDSKFVKTTFILRIGNSVCVTANLELDR